MIDAKLINLNKLLATVSSTSSSEVGRGGAPALRCGPASIRFE